VIRSGVLKVDIEPFEKPRGAELAGQAMKAELVDEIHLFLAPVVVGAGKRSLPRKTCDWSSSFQSEQRFGNGTVHLHYRTTRQAGSDPRV